MPNTAAVHMASEQMDEHFIGLVRTYGEVDEQEYKTKGWFVYLKVKHRARYYRFYHDLVWHKLLLKSSVCGYVREEPLIFYLPMGDF